MLKLIKNEGAKIFLKNTTYIFLVICLLFGLAVNLLVRFATDSDDGWVYGEDSFEDTIADDEASEEKDIYLASEIHRLKTYIDMGYENYNETPGWIVSAMEEIYSEHYVIYLAATDKTYRESADENGVDYENCDVDFEKETFEAMIKAVREKDYTQYYRECNAYVDACREKGISADTTQYEAYKYMIENEINPEEDTDKINLLNNYSYYKSKYDAYVIAKNQGELYSESELQNAEYMYMIYKYQLDNNLDKVIYEMADEDYTLTTSTNLDAMLNSSVVASMAGFLAIIIAAGMFANEFSTGTVKFLLINPVKRSKIFWSKYITSLLVYLAAMIIFFAAHMLCVLVLYGGGGLSGVYLTYADGAVGESSALVYAAKTYAMYIFSGVSSMTVAFTISAFLRSSALAIVVSLLIEMVGQTVSVYLYSFGYDWGRFLLFSNTDIASIAKGSGVFPAQTTGFSLTVIAVYIFIMLLTAYDGFTRKEV